VVLTDSLEGNGINKSGRQLACPRTPHGCVVGIPYK
jgi:hypothetical protein